MMRLHQVARALLCACIMSAGCVHFQAPGAADEAAKDVPKDTIELPGRGRVHVIDRNPSARETVLLVHGYGASWASYRPVVSELSTAFRVLAVDLPGFGGSERLEGDYSPDAMADALVKILDAKGVRRAHVIGHSWGGSVVLAFALRHPDRLGKLGVISGWVWSDQLIPLMRWARAPGLGEFLFALFYKQALGERLYLNFHDASLVSEELVEDVEAQMEKEGSVAVALAAARGMARFEENEKRYKTISAPTLLVWGREDKVSRVQFGEKLARQIPHARFVVLPSCGHIPMWECTPGTVDALKEFLGDAEVAAAGEPGRAGAE